MDICDKRLLKFEKRNNIYKQVRNPSHMTAVRFCPVQAGLGEGGMGGRLESLVEGGKRRGEVWVRGGRNREENQVYTALRWAPSAVCHALEKLGVNVKGNSNYVKSLLVTER